MRVLFHALVLAAVALAVACAGGGAAGGTSDVVARIPFASGERLVYALHDDTGAVVARGELWVIDRGDGYLVLTQEYEELGAPASVAPTRDLAWVVVDETALQPLEGFRSVIRRDAAGGTSLETFSWDYRPGAGDEAPDTLVTTVEREGEAEEERELRLRDHTYDNESSLWLWRTLDLSDSYEARYVSVNHAERSQQTVILRVTGRQTVDVPAGEFDSWRLQVRNGRATRVVWIEVESPHRVVQWDNGSLVFRLESIGDDASRAE
jgi:hypothetical protein